MPVEVVLGGAIGLAVLFLIWQWREIRRCRMGVEAVARELTHERTRKQIQHARRMAQSEPPAMPPLERYPVPEPARLNR